MYKIKKCFLIAINRGGNYLIAQKSYKALFPLWSLKKKDMLKQRCLFLVEINKLKIMQRKVECTGNKHDTETKKKVKTILILFCMNSKKLQISFSYRPRGNYKCLLQRYLTF